MNFGQAFLFLFALANSVNAKTDDPNERLLATSRDKSTFHVRGYHEHLGECNGAVCGLWGDPHILTCDGLGYDCNAAGLFTIMKNFLYNIQGNFIHVNSVEMGKVLGWGNFPSATYTNDIIIQNVEDPSVPVMQFTFPTFFEDEDIDPNERGCFKRFSYTRKHELARFWTEGAHNIVLCREACENNDQCEKFVYKHDKRCQLYSADAQLVKIDDHWSYRVAGPVNKCGHPEMYNLIEEHSGEQLDNAKVIPNGAHNKGGCKKGDGCPINFYLDGALIDISNMDGDYLYGNETSPVSARFTNYNQIRIKHTTKSGGVSEIMLETAGDGPGALFSCHWNMFVCLPRTDETAFHNYEGGAGLFGSPDNNSHNDWMTTEGQKIDLPGSNGKKGQAAYDYCLDNWCVSQEDSLMMYPEGSSYEQVKCKKEEYLDVHDPSLSCYVSADKMNEVCGAKPLMLRAACEIDCCTGGCEVQDELEDEIKDIVDLSKDPDDCIYPTPTPPAAVCDDNDNFLSTGETACPDTPSGDSIVKVIDSSTSVDIPDGQPIIYGIKFIPVTDDDHGRRITFRVDNPFGSVADTYVRYQKEVGEHANDPDCEALPGLGPGCDVDAEEITVGCVDYPGVDPFTIVDVYFASQDPFVTTNADDSTEVEKCCKPPQYDGSVGVIKYSFKIQCVCPTVA